MITLEKNHYFETPYSTYVCHIKTGTDESNYSFVEISALDFEGYKFLIHQCDNNLENILNKILKKFDNVALSLRSQNILDENFDLQEYVPHFLNSFKSSIKSINPKKYYKYKSDLSFFYEHADIEKIIPHTDYNGFLSAKIKL